MDSLHNPEQILSATDFTIIAQLKSDDERLRTASLDERGEMIRQACQAAAEIEVGRIRSGLPPTTPAPWPSSTWEFLREHAAHVRR